MKLQLQFKTPDVARDILKDIDNPEEYHKAIRAIDKFVAWSEYVTIEIDTETQTAVVLPA